MKYAQQQQTALDRLDQALAQLRNLIKRGDIKGALHYMEKGQQPVFHSNIITMQYRKTVSSFLKTFIL